MDAGPLQNEQPLPLSERASEKVERPAYWRDLKDMLEGDTGVEYEKAFLKVQQKIDAVILGDRDNAFSNSKYATLGNLLDYVRPILHDNGFTLKQFAGAIRAHGEGGKKGLFMPIASRLCHVESAQWEMVSLLMPVDHTSVSVGSAMTYGKRYTLMSLLGIATADDDGMAFLKNRVDQEEIEKATDGILEKINACKTEADLKAWLDANEDGLKLLSEAGLTRVRNGYGARLQEVKAK